MSVQCSVVSHSAGGAATVLRKGGGAFYRLQQLSPFHSLPYPNPIIWSRGEITSQKVSEPLPVRVHICTGQVMTGFILVQRGMKARKWGSCSIYQSVSEGTLPSKHTSMFYIQSGTGFVNMLLMINTNNSRHFAILQKDIVKEFFHCDLRLEVLERRMSHTHVISRWFSTIVNTDSWQKFYNCYYTHQKSNNRRNRITANSWTATNSSSNGKTEMKHVNRQKPQTLCIFFPSLQVYCESIIIM